MIYRLKRRCYPYVPDREHYGQGHSIPWPKISMLAVGYKRMEHAPGNLYVPTPDAYGYPDGGRWEILQIWQTGWMSIRSLITGEIVFSVPPDTLEPLFENSP